MKRKHKILIILLAVAVTVSLATVPAFALTESEVQDQVNAVGKESVTGNLFVWFLCAIAFLKVSQKIDSFMSSLGINYNGEQIVLFVGKLTAFKGADTLLRAAKQYERLEKGKIITLIVGSGDERKKLEALKDSLGLKGVFFLGHREQEELRSHEDPRRRAEISRYVKERFTQRLFVIKLEQLYASTLSIPRRLRNR